MVVLLIVLYISLIIMSVVAICCCFGASWRKGNKVLPNKEDGDMMAL